MLPAGPGLGPGAAPRLRGYGWLLVDAGDAGETFRKIGMLPQQFPLDCVALLPRHRRDIKRIIRRTDGFDGLLWPTMNPGYPRVSRPVSTVRIIGPDPGQVGGHDLVCVLFELAGEFCREGFLCEPPPSPAARIRGFSD